MASNITENETYYRVATFRDAATVLDMIGAERGTALRSALLRDLMNTDRCRIRKGARVIVIRKR